MIVAQINTEYGIGSTGRIVQELHDQLVRRGDICQVFCSGNHTNALPNSYRINSKIGLRIHQIQSRILGDQGCHSSFATRKLVADLKALSPDVIHLHNLHGYYLNIEILFQYLKSFHGKIVWTLHDCWAFTGHCTHFADVGCERWKSHCGNCPQLHSYPYSWFLDCSETLHRKKEVLFSNLNRMIIVTPSDWLASLVRKSFLGRYPIHTIHNGVDQTAFRPTDSCFRQQHHLEDRTILLGVAAAWSAKKGLDVFIQLAEQLSERYQIVLVGTDSAVEQMLPSKILSIRRTHDIQQLAEIYSAADIFINPTRADTFPTVNLEAISCGTPVITYDSCGCRETVPSGCGVVISERSAEGIRNALQKMDAEGRLSVKLHAPQFFDHSRAIQQYMAIYDDSIL